LTYKTKIKIKNTKLVSPHVRVYTSIDKKYHIAYWTSPQSDSKFGHTAFYIFFYGVHQWWKGRNSTFQITGESDPVEVVHSLTLSLEKC
jgi:hypothetical protein